MKVKFMKADMHVHLPKNVTKEQLIKVLKQAKENKVQAISFVGYNFIDLYKTGGVLHQLIQEEGIESYYDGKIITGVEMVTTAKGIESYGKKTNYYGERFDILLYDFNPEEMEQSDWFQENQLEQKWYQDCENFIQNARSLGVTMPSKDAFLYDGAPVNFISQWWIMLEADAHAKKQLETILGRTLLSGSDLLRNFVMNPKGMLFIEQLFVPKLNETLQLAKQYHCKVSLAHPAYMNTNFDYEDYILSNYYFSGSSPLFQKMEFMEGYYMLNTTSQTELIYEIAKQLSMGCTGGSDFQDRPQMYFIAPNSKEKTYYAPTPGFAIHKSIETGNGDILIQEAVINQFKDVREYPIYHKKLK